MSEGRSQLNGMVKLHISCGVSLQNRRVGNRFVSCPFCRLHVELPTGGKWTEEAGDLMKSERRSDSENECNDSNRNNNDPIEPISVSANLLSTIKQKLLVREKSGAKMKEWDWRESEESAGRSVSENEE